MPFPVLIRYDKGYRGQTDQYRKDFENVGNNAPYDSRHIVGRGYDDPNGYQSWYHNQVNENTGRRSPSCERNDNPPLRTSRQRQAGFRARRALRKHNRKADRKYRYGSAMSESGSKTGSRKPQSQRLGLLVTGIIFHELRALVKFRIGNVTGVHPSDEVARGKKGMTLHP